MSFWALRRIWIHSLHAFRFFTSFRMTRHYDGHYSFWHTLFGLVLLEVMINFKEGKLTHPGHIRASFYFPVLGNYGVSREWGTSVGNGSVTFRFSMCMKLLNMWRWKSFSYLYRTKFPLFPYCYSWLDYTDEQTRKYSYSSNRILFISYEKDTITRVSEVSAHKRNKHVMDLADEVGGL